MMSTGRFFAETLQGHGVTHVFIVPAIFHQAMTAIEATHRWGVCVRGSVRELE
jgi:thiamine pyrophosphate-dependent acetolactate synthase large subunit-like protein